MFLKAGLVALLSTCIAGCDESGSLAPIGDVPPHQVTFLFKMHGDVSGSRTFALPRTIRP
jgi:hypothetical protein